ncbi:uncharacterized protein LOC127721324 [Mytilus californianus]|uniref:uncharacterized protein LOC127721324 n=1 Tax=Mytilus californianus TaxID=6549 RepID=UPI002247EFBE|nr:uncharacterized protein LOC127721324 [Mytilus californianus]XP_052084019.1 uncharacterized protein LOC127721324 [Mytilus californianus]
MADMFHGLEEVTSFSENSEDIPSIFQQFDVLVTNRNKNKKDDLVENLRKPGHNHALDKMMLQHLNKKLKPKRKVSSVPLLYIPGETNSSIVTIDQETFRGLVGNPKPKQRQSRKKEPKTNDLEDSKVPISQTLPFEIETVLQEVETVQLNEGNCVKNQKVECAICGVKFENSLRLKQHSRVHRRCINNGRRYSPKKTLCYPYLIPENFANRINSHGGDMSNKDGNKKGQLSTKTVGQCPQDISSSVAMPIVLTNGKTTCVSINENLVNTFSDPKNGAILSNILQNFVQQDKNNSTNSNSDRSENSQPITITDIVLSDKNLSETDAHLIVSDESVCTKGNKHITSNIYESSKSINSKREFSGSVNSNFSNTENVRQKITKRKSKIENLSNGNAESESKMVEDRSENVYNDSNSNQSEPCVEEINQSESFVDKTNDTVRTQCNTHRNMNTNINMKSSSKSSSFCQNTFTLTAEIHAPAFDNACNWRISNNEVKTFNGESCQGIENASETETEQEKSAHSEYMPSIQELEKGALMALKKLSAQTSPRKGIYSPSALASPMKGSNSLSAQAASPVEEGNCLSAQASPMKEVNSLSAQTSQTMGSPKKGSNSLSAQAASPMKGSNCLSAQASPMKRVNSLSAQTSLMKGSNSLSNRTPCKRRMLVRSVQKDHCNGDQSSYNAEQREISFPVTEKSTNRGDNVRTLCNQTETNGSPCTRMVEFVKQIEQICKNKHCLGINDLEGKQSQNESEVMISDRNGESSVFSSPPYLDDLSFRNTTKYCGISLNNDQQNEGIETIQNHQDYILNDSFCSRTSSYYDNMKRYKSWKNQSVDSEKLNSNHRNHVCDLEDRAVILNNNHVCDFDDQSVILNNNHDSDEVIQNSCKSGDEAHILDNEDKNSEKLTAGFCVRKNNSNRLKEDGKIAHNSDTPNFPTAECSELDGKMQENRNIAQNLTGCYELKNMNEVNATVTQNFERPLADLCELENVQEDNCNVFENDEICYHTETDIFTDGSIEQSPRMTQIVDPSHKEAFLRYRQLHYDDSILRDENNEILDHDASLSNFSSSGKIRNQQLFKRKIFEDETSLVAMQTVNNDLEQITLIDEKGDIFECLQNQKKGDNQELTFADYNKNTQNRSSIAKNLFKNFCKKRSSGSDTDCNVYAEIMKLPKNKDQYEVCYETTSTDDSDASDQGELLHRKTTDHKSLLLKCSRLCSYLENMERMKCQKRLLKCSVKDKVLKTQKKSKKLKSNESSAHKSEAFDKNTNKGKNFKNVSKDTKKKERNSDRLIKDRDTLQSQNSRKRKVELRDLHDGNSVGKCRKVCNSKRDDIRQDNEEQRKEDSKLNSGKLASTDDKLKTSNKNINEKCSTVNNRKKELELDNNINLRKSPRKRFVKSPDKTENLNQRKERINCVMSQKKASQKQRPSKLSTTEPSDSCVRSLRKSPRKSPAKLILTETGGKILRKSPRKTGSSLKVICLSEEEISLKNGPRKTVSPSEVICLSKDEIIPRKSPRKTVSCSEVICMSKDEIIPRRGPRKTVSHSEVICLSKDEIIPRKSPRKTVSHSEVICLSKDEIIPRKSPRKLKCKYNCVMDCCSSVNRDKKLNLNVSKSDSLQKKSSFDKCNEKGEKLQTKNFAGKKQTKMTINAKGKNESVKNSRKEIKENEKKGENNEKIESQVKCKGKTEKDKLKIKLFSNMSGKERMARVTKSGRKTDVNNSYLPLATKNRNNGHKLRGCKNTCESDLLDRSKTNFSLPKQKSDRGKNERVELLANKSSKKLKISPVKCVQDFPPNKVPCFKTPEKVLDLKESSNVCVQSAEKMTPKKRWKALFHSQANENKHIESIVHSKNNQSEFSVDQRNQSVSSIVEESSQSGTSTSAVDKNNQLESNFDKRNQSVSSNVKEISQSESSIAGKSNQSEYSRGNRSQDKCTEPESCKDKTFVLNSQKTCTELIETQNIHNSENISQIPYFLSFVHSETTENNNNVELSVNDERNQTEPCVEIINQSESCVDKNNQLEPCVKRSNHSESCDDKSNQLESSIGKINQLEFSVAKVSQSDLSIDRSNQLESGSLTIMPTAEIENSEHSINESDDEFDSDESWLDASFSCARFIQYSQVRNSLRTLPFIEQMRL